MRWKKFRDIPSIGGKCPSRLIKNFPKIWGHTLYLYVALLRPGHIRVSTGENDDGMFTLLEIKD